MNLTIFYQANMVESSAAVREVADDPMTKAKLPFTNNKDMME